jgi:multiple sugar transport system permease protein
VIKTNSLEVILLKQSVFKKSLNTVIALIILAFMLFPLYWAIVASLETKKQLFQSPPSFFPPTPSLSAYVSAFSMQWPHLLTSLIISIGTVIFALIIATPAAYALAKFRFRITAYVVIGLLITQMIPNVILANSLYVIFNKIHLLNTYAGIILADSSIAIPFSILILRAFMQSIPYELTEAALVDGANDWKTFIKIIVPVSKSAIITAGLFAFLNAWGDFLFALTMMTEDTIKPITVSLYSYIGQYSTSWNEMMASAVLASIPAAILLLVSQRYITAGLGGSVKG